MAAAWHLCKRRFHPVVLDRRTAGLEASAAGAGMLPLHSVAFDTEALYELSRLSDRLYPGWIREIQKASGCDPEWEVSGSLGLLHNDREEANAGALGKRLVSLGLKVEWLTGKEARRIEPVLKDDVRAAMSLPETVQIRPAALCGAVAAALEAKGVKFRAHEAVEALVVEGRRIKGVKTSAGILEADKVLLASGAWTSDLLRPLGVDLPVFPLRGQVLLLQGPSGRLKRILFSSGFYLVPRRGGELYVGSTLEKAGFHREVTPAGLTSLSSAAQDMVPGLQPLRVSGYFAGFRPGSEDGHPFLGPVPGIEGLFIAAGHHTHGHLLAPATGHLMAQLLADGKTDLPLEPFRVGRKPHELQSPWWMRLSAS